MTNCFPDVINIHVDVVDVLENTEKINTIMAGVLEDTEKTNATMVGVLEKTTDTYTAMDDVTRDLLVIRAAVSELQERQNRAVSDRRVRQR